jgi:hypothetical protein
MSAPKNIAKRQKIERKKRRKKENQLRRQKKQQTCFGLPNFYDPFPAAFGPIGGVKMSEVLQDFVAPWFDSDLDRAAYERLLSMATVAWNAALQPEYERASFISSMIDAAMSNASIQERLFCREFIEELVLHKLKHFAKYHRPILSFQLTELEDGGWYISVASAVC